MKLRSDAGQLATIEQQQTQMAERLFEKRGRISFRSDAAVVCVELPFEMVGIGERFAQRGSVDQGQMSHEQLVLGKQWLPLGPRKNRRQASQTESAREGASRFLFRTRRIYNYIHNYKPKTAFTITIKDHCYVWG